MTTAAERREQLEGHLQAFRQIADQRVAEKIVQWSYHLPALVSAAIFICQVANTIIFASFAYNFGKLYILLDEYMRETDAMNITLANSTAQFRYAGVNADRINEIDNYHDQLWNLFIAEVIELIFPAINLVMFGWIVKDKRRRLPTRVQIIYLLCPALALILSITQALTIHVSITESIYTIRFLLVKLLGLLLELNRKGRLPIEQYFQCEFFNDDDIVKPPCSGQIHDTVLSRSTLSVVITIHVIPIIICVYLLIRNLKSNKLEHLFLYIESVPNIGEQHQQDKLGGKGKGAAADGTGKRTIAGIEHFVESQHQGDEEQKMANGTPGHGQQRTLRETLNDLLVGFNVKFVPKKVFCEQMQKSKVGRKSRAASGRGEGAQQQNSQQMEMAQRRQEDRRPETSL